MFVHIFVVCLSVPLEWRKQNSRNIFWFRGHFRTYLAVWCWLQIENAADEETRERKWIYEKIILKYKNMINDCLLAIKIMSNDTPNWMILKNISLVPEPITRQPTSQINILIYSIIYNVTRWCRIVVNDSLDSRSAFFFNFFRLIDLVVILLNKFLSDLKVFYLPLSTVWVANAFGSFNKYYTHIRSHTHTNLLRVLHRMRWDARADSLPGIKH